MGMVYWLVIEFRNWDILVIIPCPNINLNPSPNPNPNPSQRFICHVLTLMDLRLISRTENTESLKRNCYRNFGELRAHTAQRKRSILRA